MRSASVIKFPQKKLEPITKCCSLESTDRDILRGYAEAKQSEETHQNYQLKQNTKGLQANNKKKTLKLPNIGKHARANNMTTSDKRIM